MLFVSVKQRWNHGRNLYLVDTPHTGELVVDIALELVPLIVSGRGEVIQLAIRQSNQPSVGLSNLVPWLPIGSRVVNEVNSVTRPSVRFAFTAQFQDDDWAEFVYLLRQLPRIKA